MKEPSKLDLMMSLMRVKQHIQDDFENNNHNTSM